MQLIVNGNNLEVEPNLTLLELLARFAKSTDHVAVERNGQIVEHDDFATLTLHASDQLEIVHFVGGG